MGDWVDYRCPCCKSWPLMRAWRFCPTCSTEVPIETRQNGADAPEDVRTNEAPADDKQSAIIRHDGERIHFLKTWPFPFEDVKADRKPFEYRRWDRDFRVNDILVLEKWSAGGEKRLDGTEHRRVTYLLPGGSFGVPNGYCVMGLAHVQRVDNPTVDHEARENAMLGAHGDGQIDGLQKAWLIAHEVAEASSDQERKLGALSVAGKIHNVLTLCGADVPNDDPCTADKAPAKLPCVGDKVTVQGKVDEVGEDGSLAVEFAASGSDHFRMWFPEASVALAEADSDYPTATTKKGDDHGS